jgi:glycogen debranching enzyme
VTPRRGKAVEINALWYNALRLMERWAGLRGDRAESVYRSRAEQCFRSFNDRFWNLERSQLFDVVDSDRNEDDSSCRPNQIFSIALPHPALAPMYWKPVVLAVRDRLLTPVGLRSLAPDDPAFKSRYYGDLRSRDAAYHQGTVWAWLVGPFVEAWLKVFPDDLEPAHEALAGFQQHLNEACIGSISEIFDAESPFTPRGCIAQAWSVAELLRIWTMLGRMSPDYSLPLSLRSSRR